MKTIVQLNATRVEPINLSTTFFSQVWDHIKSLPDPSGLIVWCLTGGVVVALIFLLKCLLTLRSLQQQVNKATLQALRAMEHVRPKPPREVVQV